MNSVRKKNMNIDSYLINSIIKNLPPNLNFPSYQYCRLSTKLKKYQSRVDTGINLLRSKYMTTATLY